MSNPKGLSGALNKQMPEQLNATPLIYDGNEGTTDGVTFKDYSKEELKSFYAIYHCKNARDDYEPFRNMGRALMRATQNRVNLFKNATFNRTALRSFLSMPHITGLETQHVGKEEGELITKTTYHAIIYSKPGTYEKCHKYDYKSFYPAQLVHNSFPVVEGRFDNIKKLPKGDIPYGFYRCKLHTTNWTFPKRFHEWVTHIDIQSARDLNIKVTLIVDDEPNAYIYDEVVSGKELFGPFVYMLYPLKESGVPGAKEILNMLWGALCQARCRKYITPLEDVPDLSSIYDEMTMREDGRVERKYIAKNKPFRFTFARIKPFLLAMGRARLREKMFPQLDHVVWAHTDGFIMDTYCKGSFGDANRLGALQSEGMKENMEIETNPCTRYKDGFVSKYKVKLGKKKV